MMRFTHRRLPLVLLAASSLTGCGGAERAALLTAETFNWIRQPIAFCPPPAKWERQGDNGGGLLGVRFILRGGGGQVMSVSAFRLFAERDRREVLSRLIGRRDSLTHREFMRELSLARARTDDPLSDREAETAQAINAALDRAMSSYLADQPGFATANLDAALRAATRYEATLEELLPRIRLQPQLRQEPDRWRLGYERDTVIAGQAAYATDDTLYAPEQKLLYQEVFWVVNGCAFKATFQGREENLDTFRDVVETIRFPQPHHVASN